MFEYYKMLKQTFYMQTLLWNKKFDLPSNKKILKIRPNFYVRAGSLAKRMWNVGCFGFHRDTCFNPGIVPCGHLQMSAPAISL